MAFDAGMLACVVNELNTLGAGGKIEKIYQPEKEEIILLLRSQGKNRKLIINVGSSCPRIGFTEIQKENPLQAPMFCMLLRKHLIGATLSGVSQEGFERVARLTFDTRDEMGFECKKYIFAEIMGKYSNLIFADENFKVVSALKIIDFTTSSLRQILPGMIYELPPIQNKQNPLEETREGFAARLSAFPADKSIEKFIISNYLGISSSNAREIAFCATRKLDALICECSVDILWTSFCSFTDIIKNNEYSPCVIFESKMPIEYSFVRLSHYGNELDCRDFEMVSECLDAFFEGRDKEQRIKQRAADILRMLTNTESRLLKKLEAQRKELAECELGEKYKKYGDLITSNLYMLTRGQTDVELTDYEAWDENAGEYGKVIISLDSRLSPAANAQRYYKRYNKSKTAKVELAKQIDMGERELEYIYSVFDSLTKAETTADLCEIRDELYRSGYASKMKGYSAPKKQPTPSLAQFETTNGYKVYCGKNNIQNEYITHKVAEKHDYWFHAKNVAGSHVLMVTNGEEPPAEDFTDACMIAAYYSKAKDGESVEVDYLFARGVKKVPGAKPGFVVYHNNWSAYVTPDEEKVLSMRIK
ncbi:MAG: fibronectin/fibrinogen-binding protein [Ruminococcaceae bacterium]|nr:fibronectin/fibrinogen-binding protein [Oscillospiraceae bacterium]